MPTLNEPQAAFLELPHKFRAFVGGFGSGKTWAGCAALCRHFWEHPGVPAGYFAPTYPQIRDIFWPTLDEVAEDWGLRIEVLRGDNEVRVYCGRQLRGKIICRSMDDPRRIVGFKIGYALVDEIDTMSRDKAHHAWRKIIARLRFTAPGLRNGIDVTTTPEGFHFVYEQFHERADDGLYGIIHASTYDNAANLPDDYIASLVATYPEQLVRAYLNGEFVNLTSGCVYPAFDRKANNTEITHEDGEHLHVGMDFNVLNMTAVVCVVRGGLPVVVDELTGIRDTPAMIDALIERYGRREMTIYPDASGKNAHTNNASVSDLGLLRAQRHLRVQVGNANPPVRARVVSVNAMLCNAKGQRRLKINVARCPVLARSLEQQAYDDNAMPDKSSGLDHAPDALGYFIYSQYAAADSARDRHSVAPQRGVRPYKREWLEYSSRDTLDERRREMA